LISRSIEENEETVIRVADTLVLHEWLKELRKTIHEQGLNQLSLKEIGALKSPPTRKLTANDPRRAMIRSSSRRTS
jgi:hypothetical protein